MSEKFEKMVLAEPMPDGPFQPGATYCPHSDTIDVHFSKDMYYGEYISNDMTIYRSRKTNEIVGCHIRNPARKIAEEGRE